MRLSTPHKPAPAPHGVWRLIAWFRYRKPLPTPRGLDVLRREYHSSTPAPLSSFAIRADTPETAAATLPVRKARP